MQPVTKDAVLPIEGEEKINEEEVSEVIYVSTNGDVISKEEVQRRKEEKAKKLLEENKMEDEKPKRDKKRGAKKRKRDAEKGEEKKKEGWRNKFNEWEDPEFFPKKKEKKKAEVYNGKFVLRLTKNPMICDEWIETNLKAARGEKMWSYVEKGKLKLRLEFNTQEDVSLFLANHKHFFEVEKMKEKKREELMYLHQMSKQKEFKEVIGKFF